MEPRPVRTVPEAIRALRRRADVRAVERVARETSLPVRVVGGAVRGAFLGHRGGDLDIAVEAGRAGAFSAALARTLGTRPIAIGPEGKRIVRIPWKSGEVDVWETDGGETADLLRRDFTVNAFSVELPSSRFAAPPGALEDLRRRRLVPPREGVFLEDPLRVLRAARFEGVLTGFRVAASALPEIRLAAAHLAKTAPERRLEELDQILSLSVDRAAAEMKRLESWGALAALLPGTSAEERRQGLRAMARASSGADPAVRRALLLSILGPARAATTLREWKASRRDIRLTAILLALPRRRPDRPPDRREVVETLRRVSPFEKEAAAFLSASTSRGLRLLASSVAPFLRMPSRLARVLAPARPLPATDVASLLGVGEGPELGAALRELDVALAAHEVRGRRQAVRFLLSLTLPGRGATVRVP